MLADPFDRNRWKQTSPLIKQLTPESESTTNAASEPFEEVSLGKGMFIRTKSIITLSRKFFV